MQWGVPNAGPVCAFICVTPLQALIAERIISYEGIGRYIFLFTNTFYNEKIERYYQRLAAPAVTSDYLLMKRNRIANYARLAMVYKEWRHFEVERIYFGSINSAAVQFFAARFPNAKRFSFDDGTANVLEESAYFRVRRRAAWKALVHRLARGKVDQQALVASVEAHYTIYSGLRNIVDDSKLVEISLAFDDGADRPAGEPLLPSVTIFLGQPLPESAAIRRESYVEVVRSVSPCMYLPHPGETTFASLWNVVHTDRIAEEFLIAEASRRESVRVYSLQSSALLNVRHPRMERFAIDLGLPGAFNGSYLRIAKQVGCSIVSVN
ncbi:glycosyltransferase family 52 [Thiohalocapsa halophila]|nr:glycosyltransferase family 52 [Thiohalocapsa halophila]